MRRPIEEVEADVLKYITLHMQDRAGMPPTLTEIGDGVGIAPSTAQRYVRMLVKQGLVVRPQRGLYARNLNLPTAIWISDPDSLSTHLYGLSIRSNWIGWLLSFLSIFNRWSERKIGYSGGNQNTTNIDI